MTTIVCNVHGRQLDAYSAIPSTWLASVTCLKCNTIGAHPFSLDGTVDIQCPRCEVILKGTSQYVAHLKEHGNVPQPRDMTCKRCGRQFKSEANIKEHEKLCGISASFPCETCGKRCNSQAAAEAHVRTHHKSCVCHLCGASFLRPMYLKQHIKTTHEDTKLVCHYCGKSFGRKVRLLEHLQRHTGETDFTCHVCGKGSTNAYAFSVHLATHSNEKPFKCSFCPSTFKHTKYVYLHERAVHRQVKPTKKPTKNLEQRTCPDCGRVFQRDSAMVIHRRTAHEGKNGYVCKLCGKDFKYTYLLYVHKKKEHYPEKCKYSCQYCQRPFPVRTELERHIRKHTGDRPFVCGTCGKKYAFHGSLNMHVRTQHRAESLPKYACTMCEVTFNFKSHLQRHINAHLQKIMKGSTAIS